MNVARFSESQAGSACRKPLFYRGTCYQRGKLSGNRVTRSRKITTST